jgi:hypothetical protein
MKKQKKEVLIILSKIYLDVFCVINLNTRRFWLIDGFMRLQVKVSNEKESNDEIALINCWLEMF